VASVPDASATAFGSPDYAQPNYAPGVFTDVANIQAAGIPVIATETGDHNGRGRRTRRWSPTSRRGRICTA
jgi:hypothetical protein